MIDRERAYIATADTYALLKDWEEPIFKTTEEWLSRGEPKYRYVIFDQDQWTGTDTLEIVEFNSRNKGYIKKIELC